MLFRITVEQDSKA